MELNDPGFGSGFDANLFRDKITSAMRMGLPQYEDERATFRWITDKEFAIQDQGSNPYLWSSSPTKTTKHADVMVPAAVKFYPKASSGGPLGNINSPTVEITLLDIHYEKIIGADLVVLDSAEYTIEYTAPPVGLFGVTIYTIYAKAFDEA